MAGEASADQRGGRKGRDWRRGKGGGLDMSGLERMAFGDEVALDGAVEVRTWREAMPTVIVLQVQRM